MLTVVTWKWRPKVGYRSEFKGETVNVLRDMVARNLSIPHRFVCFTDDRSGIDPTIEVHDLPQHQPALDISRKQPDCTVRLRLFDPDIRQILGERFVSLDLDCVIVGSLDPLWDRPEPIVCWGDTNPTTHYNGSMILLGAGVAPHVWREFKPETSLMEAHRAGHFGSDQAWISYKLGPYIPRWRVAHGVYSFRVHIMADPTLRGKPPRNARIIFFHGAYDPWMPEVQNKYPWVKEHYCRTKHPAVA